jgi:hypothetical protein
MELTVQNVDDFWKSRFKYKLLTEPAHDKRDHV